MSATEILTIGSVIKHRGAYNESTVYYANNQVTFYNCVFQAIGNNFSGVPPIKENTDGTIELANTTTWKCIIDNVKLYNAALSTNSLDNRITTAETAATNAEASVKEAIASLDDFKATKGAAGGIAPLDEKGLIADELLPDSATDVVEFGGFVDGVEIMAASTGSAGTVVYDRTAKQFALRVSAVALTATYFGNWTTRGLYEDDSLVPLPRKLYVDTQDKKIYRWTGEDLEEVSGQLAVGVTADTAFAGDRGVALEADMASVKKSLPAKAEQSALDATKTELSTAITTAAETEATERKATDTELKGRLDALDKFAVMTEDEYDALETKDENTYYMLTED